ncbi:hypothetical protein [Paenibacillus sp. PAMC21692]|uniref:hemoblobin-interacting domain-containing protein n=1 Tax=Paenibacillus sp. PAMC21692 TaxID=2762320 RepID=UPI00164E97B9|nr:hypothetical protein [Paenibacillus sp. PAMC21692]QNK60217.1 hypothetical protein H7F31_15940 [Paenibacillus sp. PAMC21692]
MWQYSRKGMGKLLALAIAVSLIFGSGVYLQPSPAGAEPVPVVPGTVEVDNVALSNANRNVAISFKTSVSDSVYLDKDLLEGIEIKRTEDAHYNPLSSQGDYEFDEGKLILRLNNPLSGDTNLIRIANDYLADPSGNPLSLSSANPIVVSAPVLDEFSIVSNVVSDGGRTITLNLSQPVVLRDSVELKDYIKWLHRPLASEDAASLSESGEQIIIQLNVPLAWSDTIVVRSPVLQWPNSPDEYTLYSYVNMRQIDPLDDLFLVQDYDRDIYVYGENRAFDGDYIVINNLADLDALKAAITVYKDGEVFDGDYELISLKGRYFLKLQFAEILPKGDYNLTFAGGSLQNSSGLVQTEVVATRFGTHVGTWPHYQGAELSRNSSGQTVVSLYFDQYIGEFLNPKDTVKFDLKVGENWIRHGLVEHSLGCENCAIAEDNRFVITLGKKLNGTSLKIHVGPHTIQDGWRGMIISETIETEALAIDDEVSPAYRAAGFYNNNHDVIFTFNEPVQAAPNVDLRGAIAYAANDNAWAPLDSAATVSFEGDKLILRFPNAPIENQYKFSIAAGTLADLSGNVLEEGITVTGLKPATLDLAPPRIAEITDHSNLELGKSFIRIAFNETIADHTVVNGVSRLKDYIEVSKDGGSTFSGLDANDWVRIGGNYIEFSYRAGVDASYTVKVKANAVKDSFGNVATEDQTKTVSKWGQTYHYLQGNIYADADTVLTTFADNAWGSHVYRVLVKKGNQATSVLAEDQYEVVNNTVVIKQGVFSEGESYYIEVYSYGYDNRYTYGNYNAISHHETYYMTNPSVLSSSGGIIATANVIANPHARNNFATVVFQLMKGDQPVANTAVYTYVYAGKVSASFNVSNPSDYTVKAFVLDGFSGAVDSVGLNLATVVSEEQYDNLYLNSLR